MRKTLFLLLLIFFMTFFSNLFADEQSENRENIEKTVITATSNREPIQKIPANVTVITGEEIRESGSMDIAEILYKKANLNLLTLSNNPSKTIVSMRGLGEYTQLGKILVLLNGKKIMRPDEAIVNWGFVPVEHIEKIEVIRGTNTVLYGDSAVAGVINIITKKGAEKLKTNLNASFGSNGTNAQSIGMAGSKDKLSFTVNAENYKSDGWRDRTAYESMGAGIGLAFEATESLETFFNLSYNENEYEDPGLLSKDKIKENPKQAQNLKDENEDKYLNFDFGIIKTTDKIGNFDLQFVYANKDIKSDRASTPEYSSYDIDTIGFLPKYRLDTKIFNMKNKITLGIDFYDEELECDNYLDKERKNKINNAEVKKKSIGYYFKNEANIKEDLILSFGFRKEKAKFEAQSKFFNNFNNNAKFDAEEEFTENAFELGLLKLIGEKSKVYGKYSTTYRFPFMDEKATYEGSNRDAFNKELKPETGKSYEIGGSYSPIPALDFNIAFFMIDMEDEIFYNNSTSKSENFDKTKHKGVELGASYGFEKVFLYVNYTYEKGTFESGTNDGKEMPLVPNNNISAGVDISLPYDLSFSLQAKYIDDAYLSGDNTNTGKEKLNSYTVYDTILRYKKNDFFSAFVKVKNLFDEEYSTLGCLDTSDNSVVYSPASGREYLAGVSFVF